MPLYEYVCRACEKTFEVVETMVEHEEIKKHRCPKCESTDVERRWSSVFVETTKKS